MDKPRKTETNSYQIRISRMAVERWIQCQGQQQVEGLLFF